MATSSQQVTNQQKPQQIPLNEQSADTAAVNPQDDYRMDVSKRLQTVRFFLNKTQTQLAAEVDLNQDTVARMESGLRVSTEVFIKCLYHYQHVYGINPDFLIGLNQDGVAMHRSAGTETGGIQTGRNQSTDESLKETLIEQVKEMLDELKNRPTGDPARPFSQKNR